MNYTKYILAGALSLMSTYVMSQDATYLCVSDLSTGFSYDKKTQRWMQAKFKTDNEKFIVKRFNGSYTLKKFDENAITNCDSTNTNVNGFLTCRIPDGDFFINLNSKRFQHYSRLGYVGTDKSIDEMGLTPNMTIGTCSTL